KESFSHTLSLCPNCRHPVCKPCLAAHRYAHVQEPFRPTLIIRFRDAAGQWRWRMKADNHEIIAASHRGWDAPEQVAENVRRMADALIAPVDVGVLEGANREWRWHVDDEHGDTLGKSSEGFVSRRNCEENLALVSYRFMHGYALVPEDELDEHMLRVADSM